MKNIFLLLLIAGLLYLGWTNRGLLTGSTNPAAAEDSAENAPATTPQTGPDTQPPPPAVTPHPAKESMAAAVQAYPGLKIVNSPLNKKFLELHAQAQRAEPRLLSQADWPLRIAERAARALGGGAMPTPATPVKVGRPSGLSGSALDLKPAKPRNP